MKLTPAQIAQRAAAGRAPVGPGKRKGRPPLPTCPECGQKIRTNPNAKANP
jgi:hypothetical protein